MLKVCKALYLALSLLTLTACGPMVLPMFTRLDDDNQKVMDTYWHNALTPVSRVDRQTLLGALTLYQMYETGVDRADYHAEKVVDGNRVVMDVHFQRTAPADDGFYFTVFGREGEMLRAERYTPSDIEQMRRDLGGPTYPQGHILTPAEEAEKQRVEQRMQAIQAATMPATRPGETK